MKAMAGLLLLVSSTNAFMPQPSRAVAWAVDQLTSHTDKMRDEISHELFEELGMEIKPHIVHEEKGFGDYMESFDHKMSKLRKELAERDEKYHKQIEQLRDEIRAYKVAYTMDETIVREDEAIIDDYKEENESIKRLLWAAVKLVGRRIRKFWKKANDWVNESDSQILSHYY